MLNLPNYITLSRLLLVIVFTIVLAIDPGSNADVNAPFEGNFTIRSITQCIAFWAFAVGAFTDFVDGYLARKLNLITNFGKLLDPLADKILVCAAFIYLTYMGICPFWITILIMFREFAVTGLRQLALEQGKVIAADGFGKWKTTFQIIYCILALLHLAYGNNLPQPFRFFVEGQIGEIFLNIALWGAMALTLISGLNYVWKARNLLNQDRPSC